MWGLAGVNVEGDFHSLNEYPFNYPGSLQSSQWNLRCSHGALYPDTTKYRLISKDAYLLILNNLVKEIASYRAVLMGKADKETEEYSVALGLFTASIVNNKHCCSTCIEQIEKFDKVFCSIVF